MSLETGERTVYYFDCDECMESIGFEDTVDDLISEAKFKGWYIEETELGYGVTEYPVTLCPYCAREAGKVNDGNQ